MTTYIPSMTKKKISIRYNKSLPEILYFIILEPYKTLALLIPIGYIHGLLPSSSDFHTPHCPPFVDLFLLLRPWIFRVCTFATGFLPSLGSVSHMFFGFVTIEVFFFHNQSEYLVLYEVLEALYLAKWSIIASEESGYYALINFS